MIFNSIKENYKNCIVFKWKPNITFDFKIKKIRQDNKQILWELYCYTYNKEYIIFPIEKYKITYVSLEVDVLYDDGSVIEFIFNNNENMFEPMKLRNDKIFPNFIDIALDNWNCLLNNISFN